MGKHILVTSQCFYPEQFRINDICLEWVRRGHKVTVLTGIPNYPQGKFYDGYGFFKPTRETWQGIDIIRIPLTPRGHSSVGLAFNYLSFVVSGFFWQLFTKERPDLIYMFETSPMTQCLIGKWLAKRLKVPLYLYVQDLWPQNVEIITGIHSPAVLKPIQAMTDSIYRSCDKIFATSPSFRESIQARVEDKSKVIYWPQYAEEFYQPAERRPVPEIPDDDTFKIAFTGNIGFAQGLDILPRTAPLLRGRNVRFVIVGDGRYRSQLTEAVAEYSDMFTMIDRQPPERIPELLAACDAAFISFQDEELWTKTIPAKLQSYMACGMPIIASADGETKRVITQADCGICTPLGKAVDFYEAILSLQSLPAERLHEMGMNARRYGEEHFNKQTLFDELDLILGLE